MMQNVENIPWCGQQVVPTLVPSFFISQWCPATFFMQQSDGGMALREEMPADRTN